MTRPAVRPERKSRSGGFTFIEMMIVVAIIGAMALAIYPAVNNALRTRTFDNAAKDILTTLQRAKLMAVRTKVSHRVRFLQRSNTWYYLIEQVDAAGTWSRVSGVIEKSIPVEFATTVNLPALAVTYSALGYVSDYAVNQNDVTIQSEKLRGGDQDDERIVSVYAGGSVQYARARSG